MHIHSNIALHVDFVEPLFIAIYAVIAIGLETHSARINSCIVYHMEKLFK